METSEIKSSQKNICEDCREIVFEGRLGCQRMFDEVIAREFNDYRYGRIHRLTVDVYCMQHPEPYIRSEKSFAAHLTGICSALEYVNSQEINQMVQKWLSTNPKIDKPTQLPKHFGDLTINYIRSAANADEHLERVREWAVSVWNAWSEYHTLARQLIKEASTS